MVLDASGSAEDATRDTQASGSSHESGRSAVKEPQAQSSEADRLFQEATNLLKSLRSIKAVRLNAEVPVNDSSGDWGLLDGGATQGLKRAWASYQ